MSQVIMRVKFPPLELEKIYVSLQQSEWSKQPVFIEFY